MKQSIIIAGAGGLGREVAGYVLESLGAGQLAGTLKGFLDDTGADPASYGVAVPVLGTIDGYTLAPADRVVVAVGAPADRVAVAARLERRGARFISVVHPRAWVADPASVGDGCIVAPFATIGMNARLERHCLINAHAGIGHDAILGAGTVVSPHGVVNGGVRLGNAVLVGSGAVITPRRVIGDGAQISAGAVIQADVAAGVTMWGNPARPLPQGRP